MSGNEKRALGNLMTEVTKTAIDGARKNIVPTGERQRRPGDHPQDYQRTERDDYPDEKGSTINGSLRTVF